MFWSSFNGLINVVEVSSAGSSVLSLYTFGEGSLHICRAASFGHVTNSTCEEGFDWFEEKYYCRHYKLKKGLFSMELQLIFTHNFWDLFPVQVGYRLLGYLEYYSVGIK